MTNSGVQFFIDFDGTISKNDVVDLILERFASDEWKKVEKEWARGKIGSRECLSRQIDLVSATREELLQLVAEVEIDPDFVSFLNCAKEHGLAVTIVSDGFRIVIEAILQRALKASPDFLSSLRIFSNQLEWADGHLRAAFAEGPLCEHGCANCKSQVITRYQRAGEKIVFVGDGLSDRYAAEASDLTFAKSNLIKVCEDKKINHKKYSSFRDIEEWVVKYYANQYVAPQAEKAYLVERN